MWQSALSENIYKFWKVITKLIKYVMQVIEGRLKFEGSNWRQANFFFFLGGEHEHNKYRLII